VGNRGGTKKGINEVDHFKNHEHYYFSGGWKRREYLPIGGKSRNPPPRVYQGKGERGGGENRKGRIQPGDLTFINKNV